MIIAGVSSRVGEEFCLAKGVGSGVLGVVHGFWFSLHHEGDFCSRLIDLAHQRKRLVSSKPP